MVVNVFLKIYMSMFFLTFIFHAKYIAMLHLHKGLCYYLREVA